MSSKYTVTCYSCSTFSLKCKLLTQISFSNCVVTISSCINLIHIFLQKSRNTFSPFTGSCTRLKSKSNAIFHYIKRQLRKLSYDIAMTSKINIIQNIFSSSLPMYTFTFLNKLFAYIIFYNWETIWILLIFMVQVFHKYFWQWK